MANYILKPCPCCGEKVKSEIIPSSDSKSNISLIGLKIWCPKCGISLKHEIIISDEFSFDFLIECMNDIIGLWNSRAKMDGDEHD